MGCPFRIAAPFPEVWREIIPLIEGLPLVAHNRPFDEGCLKAAFQAYGMEYPRLLFHCTSALPVLHSAGTCPTINCKQ